MAATSTANLDLLALAEDTTADRRTLSNVIDQIAMAEPDDETRRRAVSEFQSLVVALTAVRRHARATAESRLLTTDGLAAAPRLVTERASPRRQARPTPRRRPAMSRLVVTTGAILLAAAIVAAVATGLR